MPLRFRKTTKIAPGLRLNLSKGGMSMSAGGRGHSVNVGKRGVSQTVGAPGTGLSYTTKKKSCGTAVLLLLLLIFTFSFIAPSPTIAAAKTTPFKIIKLTSPVKRGAKAKLIIQTVPGAKCLLVYRTPSGHVSTAKGLGKVNADAKGRCTWKWVISTSTKPGTGQLIITANKETQRKPIIIK